MTVTPSPQSVVTVEVSGLTGSGKSAVMGEIEIALKALGLKVEHDAAFQAEKNGTHADWQDALDLYKPTVILTERNVSRAPAPSSLAGGEVERAKSWLEKQGVQTLHAEHPAVLINGLLRHIAALPPEAPAREGVEPWKEGREEGRLAARPWRKGDPVPAVGTMVLVSGANGDIESDQHRAFQWRRVIGYGVDGADFICLQNKGCWPTVERMENCWFAALTPRHEAPASEGDA